MMKSMTNVYRWAKTFLIVAGLMLSGMAIGQGLVGLNVAGEVRFPDMNNATPQETPLCFNSSSGFLGTCTQVSGMHSIAWVALQGGDYTSPIQALNEVNTWCGVPSGANRCLIRIAPGWYDLGNQQLVMRPFVDIQGSGRNMTILGGARGAANGVEAALVKGSLDSVLSHLTVFNSGVAGQTYATAYAAENISTGNNEAPPDLDHVNVKVSGDATRSYGVYLNNVAKSRLQQVWVKVNGNGNNHCTGFFAADNSDGGIANRLHVQTSPNCNTAEGLYFKDSEITVSNSSIEVATGGGDAYGVIFEQTGTNDRFSMIKASDVNTEVEIGTGKAVGAEFRGNGDGGILHSTVAGEADSGAAYGVHFGASATNSKVGYSVLIGSTASVNDEVPATKNCAHSMDADLQDIDC